MSEFSLSTHLDSDGRPMMVDVSGKQATVREAVAECYVTLTDEIARSITGHSTAKGDVLKVAELAGIMAAKRTPELIPLCHPIRLDSVRVTCELDGKRVKIRGAVKAGDVTGVEMEALMAVSAAALTVYDMCKGIDKGMTIEGTRLLRKSGGKSGDWQSGGSAEETILVKKMLGVRAGVLTVSDRGSRGEHVDTAGPALCGLLMAEGAEVIYKAIVPDEMDAIEEKVRSWSADANLILTTGGTGLSARDVTPEALVSVAERLVPGFGELMRAESMKHTSNAPLSRGLAVTVGRCLAVAMPGSERGARQCFEAIKPSLPHAVEILTGQSHE